MKISIITVCYNAEKTIEKTIKSVLNQGYKNVCLQGQDNNDHDLVYTDENNLMKTVQVKSSASPDKYGFKFKSKH